MKAIVRGPLPVIHNRICYQPGMQVDVDEALYAEHEKELKLLFDFDMPAEPSHEAEPEPQPIQQPLAAEVLAPAKQHGKKRKNR